jgi:hypothetical protein
VSRFTWGCLVYGPWFVLWLVLELTSIYWKSCPWPTLSRTVWHLEDRWDWTQIVFLAGLVVLLVHIVFKFPGRGGP